MENSLENQHKQNKLSLVFVLVVIAMLLSGVAFFKTSQTQAPLKKVAVVSIIPSQSPKTEYFSYKGANGKDALILLKRHTSVSQDNSGMVSVINGRKADSGKHEYWAFYVNGKMASVGAATYQTKDSDTIEWKIEKY